MKLRQPARTKCPEQEFQPRQSSAIWRQSYDVTTLTPVYGGGVKKGKVDLSMPVRASAIRGQLRFWWRLLKRYHPKNPVRDAQELFAKERELWGGMAENDQDFASKVRLRITEIKNIKKVECSGFLANQGKPAFDYVLFPARENAANDVADLIESGMQFKLSVECPSGRQDEVLETLRWWASFGGIGARTRRGLGAIKVAEIAPVSTKDTEKYGCRLLLRNANTAISAWEKAVEPLRKLRQQPGVGRNTGRNNRPGRSFWPEPDSIREITNSPNLRRTPAAPHPPTHPARISFPRAAFGLPIIFEFRGENTDPYKTELTTEQEGGRLASPLILKPMAAENNQFKAIALLLPWDHINNLSLKLNRSGAPRGSTPVYRLAPGSWWTNAKAADVPPISTNSGDDALTAFMNYF